MAARRPGGPLIPVSCLLESAALKRLVDPEEVAGAVALLCGPQAAAMTGTDIVVDGGWNGPLRRSAQG
nr:hypothetical protein StreXyl84_01370 [Streptomyces sp. Xyl84]